jgi:hypothetical protein
MNVKYYKKYIEKLINANPTTINIPRMEKTPDGYGGHIENPIDITETVTFYDKKSRREVVTDYGTTYVGVSVTKILAKGDADIIKGDSFIVNGTEFRVLFVDSYFDICKQIELEVIK